MVNTLILSTNVVLLLVKSVNLLTDLFVLKTLTGSDSIHLMIRSITPWMTQTSSNLFLTPVDRWWSPEPSDSKAPLTPTSVSSADQERKASRAIILKLTSTKLSWVDGPMSYLSLESVLVLTLNTNSSTLSTRITLMNGWLSLLVSSMGILLLLQWERNLLRKSSWCGPIQILWTLHISLSWVAGNPEEWTGRLRELRDLSEALSSAQGLRDALWRAVLSVMSASCAKNVRKPINSSSTMTTTTPVKHALRTASAVKEQNVANVKGNLSSITMESV